MALTDADRIQLTTMAIMRQNVVTKEGTSNYGADGSPMKGIVTNINYGTYTGSGIHIGITTGIVTEIIPYDEYMEW